MNTGDLSREEFAQAVNSSVQVVAAVYKEVNRLLREVAEQLGREPDPFTAFGRTLNPRKASEKGDDTALRAWKGRMFVAGGGADEEIEVDDADDEDDEEDGDPEEESGPKYQELRFGQKLLFAKVCVFDLEATTAEPHLMYGALTRVRVVEKTPADAVFSVPMWEFRHVLGAIPEAVGSVRTRAKAKPTASLAKIKKPAQRRLVFTQPVLPVRIPLFEINDPEKVADVVRAMKTFWHQLPAE